MTPTPPEGMRFAVWCVHYGPKLQYRGYFDEEAKAHAFAADHSHCGDPAARIVPLFERVGV